MCRLLPHVQIAEQMCKTSMKTWPLHYLQIQALIYHYSYIVHGAVIYVVPVKLNGFI